MFLLSYIIHLAILSKHKHVHNKYVIPDIYFMWTCHYFMTLDDSERLMHGLFCKIIATIPIIPYFKNEQERVSTKHLSINISWLFHLLILIFLIKSRFLHSLSVFLFHRFLSRIRTTNSTVKKWVHRDMWIFGFK